MAEWSIKRAIEHYCLKDINKNTIPRNTKISEHDFSIVKIQLFALGYIEFTYQLDPEDGEHYQVWQSTAKGKQTILNLIAIKHESN